MNGDERLQDVSDAGLVMHMAGSLPQQQITFTEIYRRHSSAVLALCGANLQDPDSALEAASRTFAAAWVDLTAGRPPREAHKLRAWLNGIARNRCLEVWRDRRRTGEMPGGDIEDDSYERASRARRAQVERILDAVAASFTERQEQIFHLSIREGLRGQGLASALGVSEKDANDATYENIELAWRGFGAYILARDGRAYCPGLAAILDEYEWDGQALTRTLRLRILRHLDICATCDNCATCNAQQRRLIAPYAPALIPILLLPSLNQEIHELVTGGADKDPLSHIRRRSDKDPSDWQGRSRAERNGRTPGPPPPTSKPDQFLPVTGSKGGHSPTPSPPSASALADAVTSTGHAGGSAAPAAPRSEAGSHLVDAGLTAAAGHGGHHACDGCDPCDGDCAPFFIASSLMLIASAAARIGNGLRRRIPIIKHRQSKGTQAALAMIAAYRRWLSHRLPTRCRYIPSCSAFGLEAIQRYGLEHGGRLAANRIRNCRSAVPLGTADPVEAHTAEIGIEQPINPITAGSEYRGRP